MEQSDRRHSRRIAVEGFVFETATQKWQVLDLSLGGMGIKLESAADPLTAGDRVEGSLIGEPDCNIEIHGAVSWVDLQNKVAGVTFTVMGESVVARLLGIMIPE